MDFSQARFNMVEQQVRPWDVLDQTVLDLLARLPREDFVPSPYRRLAYADVEIPLANSRAMMAPRVEGRMLQALRVEATDKVLEIGTGSGFVTAALAQLAREVVSVELLAPLHEAAARALSAHGISNALLLRDDGLEGNLAHGPYDVIAVTGASATQLPAVRRQLRNGGRLFQVVGTAPAMQAQLVTRVGSDQWHTENLFETVLGYLVGAEAKPRFEL